MTVSTTATRVEYSGNGSTEVFPFFFVVLDPAHVTVVLANTTSSSITFSGTSIGPGQEYTATLNTDYSVSLTLAGGDVDFGLSEAPSSGLRINIIRDTPLTQDTDYVEGDAFPAKSHEGALDKLTLQAQEIQRRAEFSISYPEGDDTSSHGRLPFASDRAGKVLTFDASGNPSAAKDIPAATVTNYAETLLDDSSASEAKQTLLLDQVPNEDATDPVNWDLNEADSNFIVGNGTTFVVESGTTVRASLGLGALATKNQVGDGDWNGSDLSIGNGGTGASNAGNARTNLGLGDLATKNADLGVADGGTGASTASGARSNLDARQDIGNAWAAGATGFQSDLSSFLTNFGSSGTMVVTSVPEQDDPGNDYDGQTYTAPRTGLYQVILTLSTNDSQKFGEPVPRINGSSTKFTQLVAQGGSGGGWFNGFWLGNVQLTASDTLEFVFLNSNALSGTPAGFLSFQIVHIGN